MVSSEGRPLGSSRVSQQMQAAAQTVMRKSIGEFVLFMHLVTNEHRASCSIRANTGLRVKSFDIRCILALMGDVPRFKSKVYKEALKELIKALPEQAGQLQEVSDEKLYQCISGGYLIQLNQGAMVSLERGGYLFSGEVQIKILDLRQQLTQSVIQTFLSRNSSSYMRHNNVVAGVAYLRPCTCVAITKCFVYKFSAVEQATDNGYEGTDEDSPSHQDRAPKHELNYKDLYEYIVINQSSQLACPKKVLPGQHFQFRPSIQGYDEINDNYQMKLIEPASMTELQSSVINLK